MLSNSLQETDLNDIERIFQLHKKHHATIAHSTASERVKKLDRLHNKVLQYRDEIKKTLFDEYNKPGAEVDLTELFPITSEIKYAKKHLKRWLKGEKRRTRLPFIGATSKVFYEPKGVVLIISPWNFPVNLTLGPLVSAISAGNCVMIKPSEHTPKTSALMKKMLSEVFDESEVAVIEGDEHTAKLLLEQPFNHIFFTGSPMVGKIVMEAASKNLTSVTLELGGKNPVIVDESADLVVTAKRVTWTKFLNNGQMCVAPDYVLVQNSVKNAFISEVKKQLKLFYPTKKELTTSYARIVNEKHFNRTKLLLEDAFEKGANIVKGGEIDESERLITPTILENVAFDSLIMQEEIFAPIMPVLSFNEIDEAIQLINSLDSPLSVYAYSKAKKNIKKLVKETRSGTLVINHSAIQFYNLDLGFGGVNSSGMGRGHGIEGFKAFSNPKGIIKQHTFSPLDLLSPPYNDWKQKLIDITLKWF